MEVPGRTHAPKQSSSTFDDVTNCQPCRDEGKQVLAKKFCQDCNEYLCYTCCQLHKKVKAVKHHDLLDITTAHGKLLTSEKTTSPFCPLHHEKVIDFFCSIHNLTFCSVCALLHHKQCKIDYIQDISTHYTTSEEYKRLQRDLDAVEKDASDFLSLVDNNVKKTQNNAYKIIDEIKAFREKINIYLSETEKILIREVERMQKEDLKLMQKAKDGYIATVEEVKVMKDQLIKVEENSNNLFVTSKRLVGQINYVKSTLKECDLFTYTFNKGKTFQDILSAPNALGSVKREGFPAEKRHKNDSTQPRSELTTPVGKPVDLAKTKVSVLPEIGIQAAQDKCDCWITGITYLSQSTLLLTDYKNKCVKKVDTVTHTISSYLSLSSNPWDITRLKENKFAVTLPEERKIQVIYADIRLTVDRSIEVGTRCLGIDSTDDKIAVSIEQGKVEILNYDGDVLCTLFGDTDPSSNLPYYITIASEKEQEVIYVSNYYTDTVTKYSLTGQELLTYKNKNWSQPRGLADCGNGQVLACFFLSKEIQVLSKKGKIRPLLKELDGIMPASVCYEPVQKIVYVGCTGNKSNRICVFHLK